MCECANACACVPMTCMSVLSHDNTYAPSKIVSRCLSPCLLSCVSKTPIPPQPSFLSILQALHLVTPQSQQLPLLLVPLWPLPPLPSSAQLGNISPVHQWPVQQLLCRHVHQRDWIFSVWQLCSLGLYSLATCPLLIVPSVPLGLTATPQPPGWLTLKR